MGFLKPTKPKIYGFILFIIGMFAFTGIEWSMKIILSRSLSPENYARFMVSITGLSLYVFGFILYLIWIYILISIVYSMAKKKD